MRALDPLRWLGWYLWDLDELDVWRIVTVGCLGLIVTGHPLIAGALVIGVAVCGWLIELFDWWTED